MQIQGSTLPISFNGAGLFQVNSTGNPVVTLTTISSTWANALTADLATGLSTAILKDGTQTITANIPWGGYKITGLGSGTLSTDAINLGQAQTAFIDASYATTATAAATTTLVYTSPREQYFTGITTQIVALPVASTMRALGQNFRIVNNSTGSLTVNSSGGNLVATIVANSDVTITCILLSGTAAASWDVKFTGTTAETGTGANARAVSPSFTTPILGTPTSGTLTNCTGYVPSNLSATTGSGSAVLATAPTISAPVISGHATIEGVTPTGATGSGNMVFATAPTLGVVAATSINFGGGALASYVPWTSFTPGITFGGGATGVVYVAQQGFYSRVGDICNFIIRMVLSSNGSSTGAALVTNLPFTVGGANVGGCLMVPRVGIDINVAGAFYGVATYPDPASTTLVLQQTGDNVTAVQLTDSNITDTADFSIQGFFRI